MKGGISGLSDLAHLMYASTQAELEGESYSIRPNFQALGLTDLLTVLTDWS